MNHATARLFIAINFNQENRGKLVELQNTLRAHSKQGNFTIPENLHLTLSFLGDCDASQIVAIKSAMDTAYFEPFEMEIDRVGYFKRNDGDIWWAAVKESKSLLDLQRKLTNSLSAVGFMPETRKYTPHITLARRVVANIEPWQIEPFGETAYKIHLMKSERIGGKLTYTSIYMRGKKESSIIVEPYSVNWLIAFEKIKAYLLPHIGDLVVDIHHVGSTSVPGLSAKPIIDFDIEIASMAAFPDIKKRLEQLGYQHQGDYGITGREVFKREPADDFMEYHMYVCPSDSVELRRHLALRDYLRANPAAANEYGALKISLARKYGNDIDAYIDGKADLIMKCLALADAGGDGFIA